MNISELLAQYTSIDIKNVPWSIPQIVAHIQKYLEEHPIADEETLQAVIDEAWQEYLSQLEEDMAPYQTAMAAQVAEASASASAASAAAGAASASAQQAAGSASAASASAGAASASAQQAAGSASAASTSAQRAADSEDTVISAASTASVSAEAASASAQQAAGSASAASASAGAASASAQQAAGSASAASASAEAASSSAQQATGAASSASSSASAAARSASSASDSANSASQVLTQVQNAGTTQINAIEEKGEEVIASIPTDYTELSDEVVNLKNVVDAKEVVTTPTLEWSRGNINSSTGASSSSTNRIYTVSYYWAGDKLKVVVPSGFKVFIYKYSTPAIADFGGSAISGWQTGTVELSAGYYYRFVCAYSDDSTITPSDSPTVSVTCYSNTDLTLSKQNYSADAKVVGDLFDNTLTTRYLLTSADDLDNVTKTGIYRYAAATGIPANAPSNSGGLLIVIKQDAFIDQIFVSESIVYSRFNSGNGYTHGWISL